MRSNRTGGFTLIELLIVIAIIGILAAVLIPNLLNARARAFDTAAQTCLKEVATNEEMLASTDPWQYSGGTMEGTDIDGNAITSCEGVTVEDASGGATDTYSYNAYHANGREQYNIAMGAGVTHVGAKP